MAYLLATLDEFKTFQKGDVPASLDGVLTLILQGITARFARHCKRSTWDYGEHTEYFSNRVRSFVASGLTLSIPSLKSIYLHHTPVDLTETFTVYDDPLRVYGVDTLLAATRYVVSPEGWVELDSLAFQPGINNVKVTYTGGYLTDDGQSMVDSFESLKILTLMQAGFVYQRRGELGQIGASLEGGSMTMESQMRLLPEVLDGLRPFRPLRV